MLSTKMLKSVCDPLKHEMDLNIPRGGVSLAD